VYILNGGNKGLTTVIEKKTLNSILALASTKDSGKR